MMKPDSISPISGRTYAKAGMELTRHLALRRAKVTKALEATVQRAHNLQTLHPKTKRHRMRHLHHLPSRPSPRRLTRARPQRQKLRLPTLQRHPRALRLQVADDPTKSHRTKVETVGIGI